MKKINKFLLFGFAIAILGSLTLNLKANVAAADVDCSVDDPAQCITVDLGGGRTLIVKGKAKPVEQEVE